MKIKIPERREQLQHALRLVLALLVEEEANHVSFDEAVESSIRARSGRRARTLAEIRGVCRMLMRRVPGLAEHPVQSINREYCAMLVEQGSSSRQQNKVRMILHGVFEHCRRQEWCAVNPMALVKTVLPVEQEVLPLNWDELLCLTRTAQRAEHRACMPALGLMLWAGVRPAEVCRLTWTDVDWEERVVVLRASHSKTGGCRHVALRAVLRAWLKRGGVGHGLICPPNWQRRWRALRDAAGLVPWRQDVLRHTFASYHAKHFHNFARLQEEMGHRSVALLRTRYLSMTGLTAAAAKRFWTPGAL